jgi:hypothetical protein
MIATSGFMEWFFTGLLVGLTGLSCLAGTYVVANLLKNPGR